MFTELYIEALLADEKAADEVWELWASGEISDDLAAWAWWFAAGVITDDMAVVWWLILVAAGSNLDAR